MEDRDGYSEHKEEKHNPLSANLSPTVVAYPEYSSILRIQSEPQLSTCGDDYESWYQQRGSVNKVHSLISQSSKAQSQHRPQRTPPSGSLDHFHFEVEDVSSPAHSTVATTSTTSEAPLSSPVSRYQDSKNSDIRHQLLTRRTFYSHDDHGPRTSSPMRKIRICSSSTGTHSTISISPSKTTKQHCGMTCDGPDYSQSVQQVQQRAHYGEGSQAIAFTPRSERATSPRDHQGIFKTPVRGQPHLPMAEWDRGKDVTPSRMGTPMMMSPANMTPGRHFVNPFEIDHTRLHLPMFSPNLFKVAGSAKKDNGNKEEFWSIEHAALIMPVEIKESDIQRQHRYQQRRDMEQDPHIQSAINKFFSNEVIVPSPWSEKVKHTLPRTPGSIKSVSCQTSMSIPPEIDIWAELGDKYLLPDAQTGASPASDIGTSFIRRRLLSQLNENDSTAPLPSPGLGGCYEELSSSPSPAKQTTPEWERQTPSVMGSGHFSSSPIRPDNRSGGCHHAISNADLLASPELSPIINRGSRSIRSSGIFHPHHDPDSSRAIMQLDFSSILDDCDDEEAEASDKMGTLVKRSSTIQPNEDDLSRSGSFQPRDTITPSLSQQDSQDDHASSANPLRTSQTTSALCNELTSDLAVSSIPPSYSSQDTGYQTGSLQVTNYDSGSNLTSQDALQYAMSYQTTESLSLPANFGAAAFAVVNKDKGKDEADMQSFSSDPSRPFSCVKLDLSGSGSFLGESNKSSSSTGDLKSRSGETVLLRKIRTLSDARLSREKTSVSRDLTQSFNEKMDESTSLSAKNIKVWNIAPNQVISSSNALISETDSPQIESQNSNSLSPQREANLKFQTVSWPTSHNSLGKHLTVTSTPDQLLFHEDISMMSASPSFNLSSQEKQMNMSVQVQDVASGKMTPLSEQNVNMSAIEEKVKSPFSSPQWTHREDFEDLTGKFSLGDNQTLLQARELLSKSEELRQKLSMPDSLEADSLFVALSGGEEVENLDPAFTHQEITAAGNQTPMRCGSPTFHVEPVDSSTPTTRILHSVKKKIDDVQGGKLGSEIAAEILKRAGEDLAQLTSLVGTSTSPR